MNIKYFIVTALVGIVFYSCNSIEENSWSVESPNKNIKVVVTRGIATDINGLYYAVSIKENNRYVEIVENSKLGISTSEHEFTKNLQFINSELSDVIDSKYTMVTGNKYVYENTSINLKLSFKNDKDANINIVFKALNNGMAFRYEFPESSKKRIQVTKEYSSFNFGEGNFWGHPYDSITDYAPGYETYYNSLKIGSKAPEGKNGWAFPMLFETKNHWALVSESGFDNSYGASHINANCDDGEYTIRLAETEEANGLYDTFSILKDSENTPWRFITIGKNSADILESHMVTDLAKPSMLKDIDWIKPGKSTWSWWSESDSPKNYNDLVSYIDLASELGWEYSLIDANWNNMNNGSLEKLAAYSKTKNVGLLIWYNSGGKHNVVTEEPRNLMHNREIRLKEFKRIRELGIKGIKVDFFQSDKQEIINQYIEILEDAASFNLVVNFHGCTLPKGWRRTYPNLLTMEAIKGAENYKFDVSFPEMGPSHITTIPFLRGVVGPTDYTPLTFSDSKYPHLTTKGFELALPVIIESGIVHFSENDEILKVQPNFILNFLKDLPVTWDAIKYLDGYPGKDAIIARKKGTTWYIGGINGENIEKIFNVDISVLDLSTSEIEIIQDDIVTKQLQYKMEVINDNMLSIKLLPYGGFVAVIK